METVQPCVLTSSVQQLNLDDTQRRCPAVLTGLEVLKTRKTREASRLSYETHGEATITSFNTQYVGCGG